MWCFYGSVEMSDARLWKRVGAAEESSFVSVLCVWRVRACSFCEQPDGLSTGNLFLYYIAST